MKQSARWFGFGRTETGYVRLSNQDVFAAINSCNFWIVADGMGGHPAGDQAAHIAVDVATRQAKEQLRALSDAPDVAADRLGNIIIAANERMV